MFGVPHAKRRLDTKKIISALAKKGIHLQQLIDDNQIDMTNFTALERCISETLNVPLNILWPSRYPPD